MRQCAECRPVDFSARLPFSGGKAPATDLDNALKSARGGFYATAGFSFFINLLLFVSPIYMLQVYDRVLSSRSTPTLVMITLAALFALVVMAVLEAIRSRVLVRTGLQIDRALNRRVFASVFRHTVRHPEGSQSQALRDIDSLREFLTGPGLLAFCDAPWVPLFLGLCFVMHPMIGLVALFGAIVIFGLALANNLVTRTPLRDASAQSIAASRFVSGSLRNAEVLQAMGMLGPLLDRWLVKHRGVLFCQARASDAASALLAVSKAFRLALQTAILGVGAWLAIQNEISPGMMIAASIIMGRALSPVELAVANWKGFLNARSAFDRVQTLLRSTPEDKERMALPRPDGRVSLQGVFVVPPGGSQPVLRGVSFDLDPGDVLGVIGPSAAGKSTLARILVGVWQAQQGTVRLDGNDIRTWDQEALGPHLGYLPQDVELFDGSVAENIARFGDIDSGRVIEAATRAGVHEMIQKLPEGYDTPVGTGGMALSGGQRQRIALARALYNNPAFVVMDEPNASLDNDGEAALMAAIQVMKQAGQTVVIITHKPSVLQVVDKVLVLRGGTVEMMGPRSEVLARFVRPTAVPPNAASSASSLA
ncbi:type I secretion system permease/ATPase [Haematospirillum sp. 15-248]|nr:type I secretion system permease/ATPase [Haematospirillum sp. 15-248]